MSGVMTAREVAKTLKISVWLVYELVKRNQIPHFTLGRNVRFLEQAILDYAEGTAQPRK